MTEYRELKCPYGDDFEGGDECDRCEQYELCMETYPPLNLIEIPKGATNGDMIKAMFPNAKISLLKSKHEKTKVAVEWNFKPLPNYYNLFYEDWWNAPYKKEVED